MKRALSTLEFKKIAIIALSAIIAIFFFIRNLFSFFFSSLSWSISSFEHHYRMGGISLPRFGNTVTA